MASWKVFEAKGCAKTGAGLEGLNLEGGFGCKANWKRSEEGLVRHRLVRDLMTNLHHSRYGPPTF